MSWFMESIRREFGLGLVLDGKVAIFEGGIEDVG